MSKTPMFDRLCKEHWLNADLSPVPLGQVKPVLDDEEPDLSNVDEHGWDKTPGRPAKYVGL